MSGGFVTLGATEDNRKEKHIHLTAIGHALAKKTAYLVVLVAMQPPKVATQAIKRQKTVPLSRLERRGGSSFCLCLMRSSARSRGVVKYEPDKR